MSTPPSSPYKSKVLIFLSRRSRRWVDQGAIAARRLKMAASWALQGLIYFIYAFFQTTHQMSGQVRRALVGFKERSNQQTRTGGSLQGSLAPTVDTPIQQALQEVAGFSLPDDFQVDADLLPKRPEVLAQPLLTELRKFLNTVRFPKFLWGNAAAAEQQPLQSVSPPPLVPVSPSQMQPCQADGAVALAEASAADLQARSKPSTAALEQSTSRPIVLVRGIATLLETRSLVLITTQNQILDILTPEQQDQLRQRIIWEVANYGRYQRIQIDRRRTLARLRLAQVNFPALSPVRWLQQSIASTPPSLPPAFTSIQDLSPFLLHPFRWAKHLWMTWVSRHPTNPQSDADVWGGSESLPSLPSRQNPAQKPMIRRLLPAPAWRSPKFTTTFLARFLPFIAPLSSVPSVAPSLIVPPVLPTLPSQRLLPAGSVSESLPAISLPAIDPSQVSESAKSATLSPTLTSGFGFRGAIALPSPLPVKVTLPAAVHPPAPTPSEAGLTAQAEQKAPQAQPDFIETRATVIGAERTVWQKVLHWLDQIFFWIEHILLAIWKLIRLYL